MFYSQDELQFYPTPLALAKKAWSLFKNKNFTRVLEPSAGEGHLLFTKNMNHDGEITYTNIVDLAHEINVNGRFYAREMRKVDCLEIDVSKHDYLRSRNLKVVGLDFMEFTQGAIYSHIIMNPPFAYGVQHVLHAWNIMYDGEIVGIINAASIKNPSYKERQYLVNLIEKHGTVEFLQDEFVEAERKADVELALIYLRKESNVDHDIYGDILERLKVDKTSDDDLISGYQENNAVVLPSNFIENQVRAFNAAVLAEKEAIFAKQRSIYYSSLLGKTIEEFYNQNSSVKKVDAVKKISEEIASSYDDLKNRAWTSILTSSEVKTRLSSNAQRRVEKDFEVIKMLEFNLSNIYGFLAGISSKQGEIQMEMACEVFDLITRYHSENACFYLGWKSNDKHRTCGMKIKTTRFVIPNNLSYGSFCHTAKDRLNDIDKVFLMLEGKLSLDKEALTKSGYVSLLSLFNDSEKYQQLRDGERLDATHFSVRFFKGIGTIHFFPKDKKLIDRFNRLVGRHRAWLPTDSEPVNEAFWAQYDKSEKFDSDLKAEAKKRARYSYDDPFFGLGSMDEGVAAMTNKRVCDSLEVVLEKHGINVDALLEEVKPLMIAA